MNSYNMCSIFPVTLDILFQGRTFVLLPLWLRRDHGVLLLAEGTGIWQATTKSMQVECSLMEVRKETISYPVLSPSIQRRDTRVFWNFKKTPISRAFKDNFWKITPYFMLKQGQFCFKKYPYFYQFKDTFQKIPLFVQKQGHHSKGNIFKFDLPATYIWPV